MTKNALVFLFVLNSTFSIAQNSEDSLFIRNIYNAALSESPAYENLRSLCKDIGARITGSAEAEMAIYWGKRLLESYDFDTVYLQEIKVPHWERGTTESAWIVDELGNISKLKITALGGSIGSNGLIEGNVLMVNELAELEKLPSEMVKDKIVFFNRPFDQKMINTFEAYGACVDQRWGGAMEAAKFGAKAVIIRSLATSNDDHPHTGSMTYGEGKQIPAAAMSTNNANLLTDWLKKGKVSIKMELDCRSYEDVISYNVIAESFGEDEKVITFGGHLDSWDLGEGAHDDGAGVIHSIEVLRILKELNYSSKHKLRCVLFMNEENGNFGGKGYAKWCSDNKELHICALESDRGAFLPMGFDIVGNAKQVNFVQERCSQLQPYHLNEFEKGYGGVDIGPLRKYYPDMLQLGLSINSQQYFDYHHSENDVFENVNKRELEMGAAAMSTMVYLMDKYLD